jgi:hypothetical protein
MVKCQRRHIIDREPMCIGSIVATFDFTLAHQGIECDRNDS